MRNKHFRAILGSIAVTTAVLVLPTASPAGSVFVQQTFSDPSSIGAPNGWTSSNDPQSQITYSSSGGASGGSTDGYASFRDNAGGTTFLVAPQNSPFLGNYIKQGLESNGVITYDHKIFDAPAGAPLDHYEIQLTGVYRGQTIVAQWTGPKAIGDSENHTRWVQETVPLIFSSEWSIISGQPSDQTAAQAFQDILANVTGLAIRMEMVDNSGLTNMDHEGIDNVTLQTVPEPGALTLVGVSLAGAGAWRRWRKQPLIAS